MDRRVGVPAVRVRPEWFAAFLAARRSAKQSVHTTKAYCQDFDAIAALILSAGGADPDARMLTATDIIVDSVRDAFSRYAPDRSAATVRRCWSSWNALCNFLCDEDILDDNPMRRIPRPKPDKHSPKHLDRDIVVAILAAIADDDPAQPRVWVERDQAVVLTCLLAGLRTEELFGANVGDVRPGRDGAIIHVRGKGRKERDVPIEPQLLEVIERYLDDRAARFPRRVRRTHSPTGGLDRWPATAPLFVNIDDGDRITRETLQYRVLRAFKRAGKNSHRPTGALLHALRHTYATELARAGVTVYDVSDLLGHESIATTQRYVNGASTHLRAAAAHNPLYRLLDNEDTE
ncbi:hypothetical protein AWC17_03155 [Mycobacterium nebraskense]|uniref:Tyr recombinase domain-containing protein n=1 Tax=Mycobacterium nebraskense TaxID=244292 RepID=A0A1X1ZNC1_9MYCO|nr:hypothetical protein AWC17_03155 [Mycobacterium nebraskense]